MTDVNELKRLVKALQSAGNDKETIDVLNTLKSEAKINESLLRESKLGLAVGKLRTNENKDISDLAKELVKKWRAQVDKEKAAAGKGKSDLSKGKPEPTRKDSLTPTTPTISQRGGPAMSAASARTAKSDGVNTSLTGDKTRDKCIELIYDGLAMDSGFRAYFLMLRYTRPHLPRLVGRSYAWLSFMRKCERKSLYYVRLQYHTASDLLLTRAKAVEDAVRSDCGGTTAAYKSKIRSLYVNLKEKHNAELRDSIASGDIAARDFAKMSSADMASEERKAANKKIEEEMFFKTLGAGEQQAETDAFQCGRCKQRKCRYRQAQTRSADEPMTTFVTCTNCNHRWKFS